MDIRNTIMDIHSCALGKYELITRTLRMGNNLLPWCRHILSIKVENAGSPEEPPKLLTGRYELQVHVQKYKLLTTSNKTAVGTPNNPRPP